MLSEKVYRDCKLFQATLGMITVRDCKGPSEETNSICIPIICYINTQVGATDHMTPPRPFNDSLLYSILLGYRFDATTGSSICFGLRVLAEACSRVIRVPSNLSQFVLSIVSVDGHNENGTSVNSQERLAEVGLDPVRLMVYIMVIRIVIKEHLTRIPPQLVSAVIIHRFYR